MACERDGPVQGGARPRDIVAVGPGSPLRLGLHETRGGFDIAVFSRHATAMSLVVFDPPSREPYRVIPVDPGCHRTGDVWHARLTGPVAGKAYMLRAEGPWDPAEGHRFEPGALLLDPYAGALVETAAPAAEGLAGLIATQDFDWGDDAFPRRSWRETVIYETHVRGFTVDPSSGVGHAGRYLGLVEKVPYLRDLGVTAVELMPVQEFRDVELSPDGSPKRNYWGYNPVALFAPKVGYATGRDPQAPLREFKTMVRALHKAGIEVILDVVFNHTAEGGESGPTFSFRGLDNAIYYLLAPDRRRYVDFTGCGNTLNCNHPVVRSLIVDCLRHWVVHMRVDGFRFDLASILGRGPDGRLMANPPLLEQIAEDPILRDTKLIAEAWDLGGAFQVGSFPGQRWAQWNSAFRDDVRRFWRGDPGMTGAFATRLCGSADLFRRNGETPLNSVNFITAHDGFTLSDLVSYSGKHNEANGEGNRDGLDENFSHNNGVEGPSEDPAVEAARSRQVRNMLASLFLSRGIPMLLGGDEFRRSQGGNNNAYCQDNALSWYDWRLAEKNADLVRFVRELAAFRWRHPVLTEERFYTDAEIAWFGPDGREPGWRGPDNRLGCMIREGGGEGALCLLFNAMRQPCSFFLPPSPRGGWAVVLDTAAPPPGDIAEPGGETLLAEPWTAVLGGQATMVLVSR